MLRDAVRRGELRAYRPTLRTIRVLREDVFRWLQAHVVESELGAELARDGNATSNEGGNLPPLLGVRPKPRAVLK